MMLLKTLGCVLLVASCNSQSDPDIFLTETPETCVLAQFSLISCNDKLFSEN